MTDEQTLLAKARALDSDALAEVHDRYYAPIYRYVIYKVSDSQVAEDLTSEVFVRLLSALQDHTAPSRTLRGWLYGVASRVVSDYHRKQYRRTLVEIDDSLPSRREGPTTVVADTLTWEAVQEAITELTEAQQEVIALRFGLELPIRETAQLLGKTEGAVKQLQARAVAALARQLQDLTG